MATAVVGAAAYLSGTAVPAQPERPSRAKVDTVNVVIDSPDADCAIPSVDAPSDAQVRCDAGLGWRMFAWIGASGDGIVQVQQFDRGAWVDRHYGPFCPAGVAAATPRDLAGLGMPRVLADAWGYPPSACTITD